MVFRLANRSNLPLNQTMPRITLDLDDTTYALLKRDRGDFSHQTHMFRFLKKYQLQITIRRRKKDGKNG